VARRWQPDEDDRLRRMYLEGAPLALIAGELRRSEDAVGARRRALGVEGRRATRPWSTLEDELLRQAANERAARDGARTAYAPTR